MLVIVFYGMLDVIVVLINGDWLISGFGIEMWYEGNGCIWL